MILVKTAVMMVNKICTITTYTLNLGEHTYTFNGTCDASLPKSGWQGSIILSAIG